MNYNCGEKNIGCLYHGWLPAGGRGGRGRGKHEDMRHIAKEYSEQITKLMYSRLKNVGHFDLRSLSTVHGIQGAVDKDHRVDTSCNVST